LTTNIRILNAVRGAGVLAFDAGRLVAFFEKAGLVEHQHGVRIAEMLDYVGVQVLAHRIGQMPAVLALER
jgi:hypothetical protein